MLRRSFTTTKPADTYSRELGIGGGDPPFNEKIDDYRGDVGGRLRRLESLVTQLPLYESVMAPTPLPTKISQSFGSGVFIVHGHAEALKQQVARALYKLTGAERLSCTSRPTMAVRSARSLNITPAKWVSPSCS